MYLFRFIKPYLCLHSKTYSNLKFRDHIFLVIIYIFIKQIVRYEPLMFLKNYDFFISYFLSTIWKFEGKSGITKIQLR